MPQPIPAAPLDIEIHSWELAGVGDLAPVLQIDFDEHVDIALLDSALGLLIASEPVLGCRLVADVPMPHWQPLPEPIPSVLTVTKDEEEYGRLSSVSPKAEIGPQISALLWRRPDSDRLILKIRHAAGDGGSVVYCLERLAELYTRLASDPAYTPAVNTNPRDLAQILKFVPKRAYLSAVRDWVRFAFMFSFPRQTHDLGLSTGPDEPWHYITREIDSPRLSALAQYGRARGATLNDVFLAAFYRALAAQGHWDGKSGLRAICAVDLRRWSPQAGRVASVCNLSSGELPFLGRELGVDYEDTLGRVSQLMQERKRGVPGLAIALLCPKIGKDGLTQARIERARKMFEGPSVPIFTNLGRIDGDRVTFAGQVPSHVNFLALKYSLPKLVLAMSGYNGAFTLSCAAADSARPKFESFLDELVRTLPA